MSILRELYTMISESDCCEVVYVDEDGTVLEEGARRAVKRVGGEVKKMYRCTSGPKKGKVVSDPKVCAQRKDPKKVRTGRRTMRTKQGIIKRKSKISKRTAKSKLVSKINRRLSGK